MAPSKVRGTGARLVNMREIFAFDRISNQEMDLAPIPGRNPSEWLLAKGDLLFARQSLTLAGAGKVSYVMDVATDTTFESHIIRVRLDPERADSQFYYYLFRSATGRERIESIVEQVAAAGIRSSDLARLKVPFPQPDEQHRIASVLGALDDLIETNRLVRQSLQTLAQRVALTSTFDVALSAIARVESGKQLMPSGLTEHYSIPAYDAGASPDIVDGSTIKSGKYRLTGPCVLISRLNPKWARAWMAYPGANAVCSTEFVPLVGEGVTAEEVWAVTSSEDYWGQVRERVTGTTGSHQRVDKAELLTFTVPDLRELDDSARATIIAAVRAAEGCRGEIVDLARTRDGLLPLLMSGRLRVQDVEAVV